MVGSAESSSRPASRGPPPDWSCRQFPPGAHSPASPSCCLSSPRYIFLSFWGGLTPGQQPASPPACGSLTSPAGKGSLGGVVAMAGIEPAAPRPGRSHVHTATPAGRCGQSARPRCLRCNRDPLSCAFSWSAPRHRDYALLGPCSSLHHVLEPLSVQEVPPPHCSIPRHGRAHTHPPNFSISASRCYKSVKLLNMFSELVHGLFSAILGLQICVGTSIFVSFSYTVNRKNIAVKHRRIM